MNERYIKRYTPHLSREFEMLAFGNGGGLPLILFPKSFGRYHQNKDFGLIGSVSSCVDSLSVTKTTENEVDLVRARVRYQLYKPTRSDDKA
jgi:esterase/lipase superfamily enzyme